MARGRGGRARRRLASGRTIHRGSFRYATVLFAALLSVGALLPGLGGGPSPAIAAGPTPLAGHGWVESWSVEPWATGPPPNGTLRGNVSPADTKLKISALAQGGLQQHRIPVSGGTYSISLAPGAYQVMATAPAYPPENKQVFVSPLQTTWQDFILTSGSGWIQGFIDPPSAHVTLNGPGPVTTDIALNASGEFNVSRPTGQYTLNATANGYQAVSYPVLVAPGSTTWDNVSLDANSSGGLSTTSIIEIGVAVGVVVLVAALSFVYLRRARRRPPPPPPEPPRGKGRTGKKGRPRRRSDAGSAPRE